MPKKALENLTESMYYVLMALCHSPMCGTEIAEYVTQKTNGTVTLGPATLYTILGKFETEQYIREIEAIGRKRVYEITENGRKAYQDELTRLWRCVMDAGREEVADETKATEETHGTLAPVPVV